MHEQHCIRMADEMGESRDFKLEAQKNHLFRHVQVNQAHIVALSPLLNDETLLAEPDDDAADGGAAQAETADQHVFGKHFPGADA